MTVFTPFLIHFAKSVVERWLSRRSPDGHAVGLFNDFTAFMILRCDKRLQNRIPGTVGVVSSAVEFRCGVSRRQSLP